MKRIRLFILGWLFGCGWLFPYADFFCGPRALALGYASVAFAYDGNVLYLNPAFLASVQGSITSYQYGSSHLDFNQAADRLAELATLPLTDFQALSASRKSRAVELLKELYSGRTLMTGFHEKTPLFVSSGYGAGISIINAATLTPVPSDVPQRDPSQISNQDVAGLKLEYLGLRLKRYTVAYGMRFSSSMYVGVAAHYLHGKTVRFTQPLLDAPFGADADTRDYLGTAWGKADHTASCLTFDAGFCLQVGESFVAGLTARNLNQPELKTAAAPVPMERRLTAGLAFRPSAGWGIYVDADLTPTDLYGNGIKHQPVSMGIEAGLFRNKAFLRAGLHNDLKEKQFFGPRANPLYCAGLGFNLSNFLADVGMGMDAHGRIANLAFSISLLMK